MGQRLARLLLTMSLFLLLTGCFFQSPEDLYAVPKAPEDFKNLQAKIDEVRAAGGEYAAPLTGNFTQTVQLRDLDGDGIQEAIAFFRMTAAASTTEKPLKIYIFRQQPDDTFAVQTIIEGEAGWTAINSIAYEDLNGDGARELVVNWQNSVQVYQLMAYAIHGDTAEEIFRASNHIDFSILDLDKDNLREIVVLSADKVEGIYAADFYDYDSQRGGMYLADSAPMSKGVDSLVDVRAKVAGYIRGARPDTYEPALFVTSNMISGVAAGMLTHVVTDVFAWRDGHLVNITLTERGISESTYRLSTPAVGLRDINSDTIMELPRPMAFSDPDTVGGTAGNFWSIQWVQYDLQGVALPVFTTYYNGEDGWYLILPEAWSALIDPSGPGEKITLSRRDVAGSGERAVVFSLWDGSVTSEPVPFLTIYKLVGPNRGTRSTLGGRFVLSQERDTIYAAEFTPGGWDCGLTAETLTGQFHLILPE